MKKQWEPERTRYRIDRVRDNGEVDVAFYGELFHTKKAAQKFIDNRGPSYRGKLKIESFTVPAGYVYTTTLTI